VHLVVQQPRHPYTQLLIQSVPEPDPKHAWGAVEIRTEAADMADRATTVEVASGLLPASAAASAAAKSRGGHLLTGCTFADRCPYVMDICRESVPPLFRIDAARAATCFLYRDRATLPSEQLSEVMTRVGDAATSA
jgi:peptide/nickel transport system ATP-binding protein